MLIDGKKIAHELLSILRAMPAPERSIVALLVGDSPSLKSFLRQKSKTADALGILFSVKELPPESTTEEVLAALYELKEDDRVGGIIVQLPLPQQIIRSIILSLIPPEKDIDCLSPKNFLSFERGGALSPPAAGAVEAIVQTLDIHLASVRAAVVGSGLLVGRPAVAYLWKRAESVEVLGEGGELTHLLHADLMVSGTGKENLIRAEYVREGAVVIDFGYPHDADFEAIDKKGGIVTPTPGGTGPIVVAKLFENFYRLHGCFPPGKK